MQRINILIILVVWSLVAVGEQQTSIGFPSVQEAYDYLRNDPNSQVNVMDGWTVIASFENGNYVLWSFTPEGHPAHPAAVKRIVLEKDGAIYIDMKALCQSDKSSCDQLMAEFENLNEKIKESIKNGT